MFLTGVQVLSILLLAAIGAKLKGPHCGLQVDKHEVTYGTCSMEWPLYLQNVIVDVVCLLKYGVVYQNFFLGKV